MRGHHRRFRGARARRLVGPGEWAVRARIERFGEPRASIVHLSGVNRELVITIAWDISWYQYRVIFDVGQPVRLAERGLELDELESSFREWNARVEQDGRIVPNIARV